MKTRTTRTLLFLVAFFVSSLSAVDGFAERTLAIKMGEAKCEKLSVSGKPANGGYHVEQVLIESNDVVSYSIDKDKGLICFEGMSLGSTKVKVRGQRYELDRYGKQESSEPFYRAFKVRVRSQKGDSSGGRMY